jgi:hypothetical protein
MIELLLAIGLFVLVPLLLLKVFLGLLVWVVVLPFRLAGGVLKLVGGAAALGLKLLFGLLGLAALVLGGFVFVILLPLLPVLLLGGAIFLIVKLFHAGAAAAAA